MEYIVSTLDNAYYIKPDLEFCDRFGDSIIWNDDLESIITVLKEDSKKWSYNFYIEDFNNNEIVYSSREI